MYLSASWTTCFIETLHSFNDEAEIAHALPRTVIGFEVHCDHLLDLTSADTLARLMLTEDDILKTNWLYEQDILGVEAITQAVGRHAYTNGFCGILTPSSVHPSGKNIALFPDNLDASNTYIVINESHLDLP